MNKLKFDSGFLQTYTSRMSGVLRWPQLEKLWLSLDTDEDWYLYEVGSDVPATQISKKKLEQALSRIDAFLREEHDAEYCGVVYTDDLISPSLLKIYHPKKMGASCGSSGSTVLPKWTLSRQPPVDLIEWALQKDRKPAWWKHMLRQRR